MELRCVSIRPAHDPARATVRPSLSFIELEDYNIRERLVAQIDHRPMSDRLLCSARKSHSLQTSIAEGNEPISMYFLAH